MSAPGSKKSRICAPSWLQRKRSKSIQTDGSRLIVGLIRRYPTAGLRANACRHAGAAISRSSRTAAYLALAACSDLGYIFCYCESFAVVND
jgi:hypothetical protein